MAGTWQEYWVDDSTLYYNKTLKGKVYTECNDRAAEMHQQGSMLVQMSKVQHPGPASAGSTYEWQAAPCRWSVIRALI